MSIVATRPLRRLKRTFMLERRMGPAAVRVQIVESADGAYWVSRTGWYLHSDAFCKHLHSSKIKVIDSTKTLAYRVLRYGMKADVRHPVTGAPVGEVCRDCVTPLVTR